MLMLSTINDLLAQNLSPIIHTAVLLTTAGELVSFANQASRSKDQVRIIVGVCTELWQDNKEQGRGMVETELGRIVVVPVDEFSAGTQQVFTEGHQPLMLLALNATGAVDWKELGDKAKMLSECMSKTLGRYREHISQPSPTSHSPAHGRA